MKRKTPSLYAGLKAILSEGMVVGHWWTKDHNVPELIRAFGKGALQRGINEAVIAGENVPSWVQESLDVHN